MRLIVVDTLQTAFEIANAYAPEHLILEIREARRWLPKISTAGAVFLGHWSPESLGDYCSGPNHTLPTYGYARSYSGLSLEDFQRRITVQELTPAGLQGLGPTARILAGLEGSGCARRGGEHSTRVAGVNPFDFFGAPGHRFAETLCARSLAAFADPHARKRSAVAARRRQYHRRSQSLSRAATASADRSLGVALRRNPRASAGNARR